MVTATMATAAGAAAFLYYTLSRRLEAGGDSGSDDEVTKPMLYVNTRAVSRRTVQAPATWLETISTLSETLRFTYSETLGKWPIGDLFFGISYLLKRQGNLHVASIYARDESVPLNGTPVIAELKYLLNLLNLCSHFSKKPFPMFLEATGYSPDDVLLQEPKAGILKPAFTILVDKNSKCILLIIRGTHSIRDTLTAVTGAIVPFHHTVTNEGGVSHLVLGYAHYGMVAAARWIAKLSTTHLTKALHEYPDYKLTVVGHSLGGGTAALLTYILREQPEFSSTSCVAFAPAACMTWELAESGKNFITAVVNEADLVPTFSAASVDDLRSEVTASAWLSDLQNQIEQTRILSSVYRSASALGSRLPSIASAKARVAGAGAILRPVSSGTQVVMKRAQSVAQAAWVRPSLQLSSWSCIGPRQRNNASVVLTSQEEEITESSSCIPKNSKVTIRAKTITTQTTEVVTSQGVGWVSGEEEYENIEMIHSHSSEDDNSEDDLIGHGVSGDRMTEVELWHQLENKLYMQSQREETDGKSELSEKKSHSPAPANEVESTSGMHTETAEVHRFYPPGKIMHIVTTISEKASVQHDSDSDDEIHQSLSPKPKIMIFLTRRSLYGKLRLSRTMINDHYMPIYRRNIEQLISELGKDISTDSSYSKAIS